MDKVKNDERFIKKKYGEDMWKLCRRLFPTILEEEGLLSELLDHFFDHTRSLYSYIEDNDLELDFQDFIMQKVYPPKKEDKFVIPDKNPYELLKEAGYSLYKCETEEDIKRFEKYYDKKERLCTFDADRLKTNYVYFAVKDNVNEIRREDFDDPKREDLYGTSVLSFQFSKGRGHALSIKNRYNHAVQRPDSTYGNNLDRIVPGLRASFAYYEGMAQDKIETFEDHMKDYVVDDKGKFHRIIAIVDNIAFCENNYIIDRESHAVDRTYLDKEKYIFMDGYILDEKEKRFINYFNKPFYRSFTDAHGTIHNIEVHGKGKNKEIIITPMFGFKPITIKLESNHIVYYKNENVKELGFKFMNNCRELEEVYLPNVEKVDDAAFTNCNYLKTIDLSNTKEIGDYFACNSWDLMNLKLNSVEKIGDDFLNSAMSIIDLYLPNVKEIGDRALEDNEYLNTFSAKNLEVLGDSSFERNIDLFKVYTPKLKEMGNYCFNSNLKLKEALFPNLKIMGDKCFEENKAIEIVDFTNVVEIGHDCLKNNLLLEDFYGPNVVKIGNNFLEKNEGLHKFYAPKLKEVGDYFLGSNNALKDLLLKRLEKFGVGFLFSNTVLERLKVPSIKFNSDNGNYLEKRFLGNHFGYIDIMAPIPTLIKYKLIRSNNRKYILEELESSVEEDKNSYTR